MNRGNLLLIIVSLRRGTKLHKLKYQVFRYISNQNLKLLKKWNS
jgi:hypothetical protein